ncbi:MAG: hypothetical protein IKS49_07290 [Actinomycetaceae bacterium]|nr:hypothetical protein [Actinomycetaceae bacterium]
MDGTQSGDMQWSSTGPQWDSSNTQYGSGDMQCDSDSTQSLAKDYLPLLIALLPIIGFLVDYLSHYYRTDFIPTIIALLGSGLYTIVATQKSKTFLAFYSLLFLASAIGTPALTTVYHYYFVSSDGETLLVGFLMSAFCGVIALLFIAIAWIVKIVGERKKRSE